jgi:hypothetical protein
VIPNPLDNQRWVDITVRWTDGANHSVSLLSVVSQ